MGVPFLGVPIMRSILFFWLFGAPLFLGNAHMASQSLVCNKTAMREAAADDC